MANHIWNVSKMFYAECQLPPGDDPELHAEFKSFDEALTWITDRRRDNPKRVFKLFTSGLVSAKMARILDAQGVIFGHS